MMALSLCCRRSVPMAAERDCSVVGDRCHPFLVTCPTCPSFFFAPAGSPARGATGFRRHFAGLATWKESTSRRGAEAAKQARCPTSGPAGPFERAPRRPVRSGVTGVRGGRRPVRSGVTGVRSGRRPARSGVTVVRSGRRPVGSGVTVVRSGRRLVLRAERLDRIAPPDAAVAGLSPAAAAAHRTAEGRAVPVHAAGAGVAARRA